MRHSNRRYSSIIKNRDLLHKYLVVPISTHTHVIRKSIGKKKRREKKDRRVFALKQFTKNKFHHAKKRPDSLRHAFGCVCGERIAEKAYTASISQAGSGEAISNFEFRHGALAPINRLTDRGRRSTTPSDKQQHSSSNKGSSSSSSSAIAAPQPQPPQPPQQQRRRRGRR